MATSTDAPDDFTLTLILVDGARYNLTHRTAEQVRQLVRDVTAALDEVVGAPGHLRVEHSEGSTIINLRQVVTVLVPDLPDGTPVMSATTGEWRDTPSSGGHAHPRGWGSHAVLARDVDVDSAMRRADFTTRGGKL